MMRLHHIVFLVSALICHQSLAQDETPKVDSLKTPFRTGRWFTGLTGSISSTNSQLDGSDKTFTNQYSIESFNGKIAKGRWLPGLRVSLNRANSSEFGESESESVYVAPAVIHYFMKNSPDGSVYMLLSFGYTRFFQRTEIDGINGPTSQLLKGNGFGGEVGLGYAYALTDNVLFDLGFNFTSFRVSAKQTLEQGSTSTNEQVNFGGIAFRFGFNVLLDDFFF